MSSVLTPRELDRIQAVLEADAPAAERIAAVRRSFPGVPLARCDARDTDAEIPWFETPEFLVFLVDGSTHCWRLTSDPETATGLVVAAR